MDTVANTTVEPLSLSFDLLLEVPNNLRKHGDFAEGPWVLVGSPDVLCHYLVAVNHPDSADLLGKKIHELLGVEDREQE